MTSGSDERYTAVFTGLLDLREPGEYPYLRLASDGIPADLQHGRPPYPKLGREVAFGELPEGARAEILRLYRKMWNL